MQCQTNRVTIALTRTAKSRAADSSLCRFRLPVTRGVKCLVLPDQADRIERSKNCSCLNWGFGYRCIECRSSFRSVGLKTLLSL